MRLYQCTNAENREERLRRVSVGKLGTWGFGLGLAARARWVSVGRWCGAGSWAGEEWRKKEK